MLSPVVEERGAHFSDTEYGTGFEVTTGRQPIHGSEDDINGLPVCCTCEQGVGEGADETGKSLADGQGLERGAGPRKKLRALGNRQLTVLLM